MDYSRNTLRILEVGAPEPRGRVAMPLRFQVQDGPGLQESGATHTLRLRANVITRVNSVADDPPRADALWRRLAAASGVEPEADAMDPQTLAIPAEELADAFEAAMIELRTLQQPPSAAVQIRLQAYEWQVRRGDAPPEAPTDADARAQVRHAAWRLLAGLPADQARRRYIALVRRLDADA